MLMDDQKDDVLRQMKVGEVAAVFHSRAELDAAIEALLTHGFDRADLRLVEGRDEIRAQLGGIEIPAEELADIPAAPRRALIDRDDISDTLVLVSSLAACVGGIAAVWYMIERGGGALLTALAALIGAGVTGGAAALILAQAFRRRQDPEEVVAIYGVACGCGRRNKRSRHKCSCATMAEAPSVCTKSTWP
jgi:hypothetical protein